MEFKSGEDREQITLFPESIDEYVEENSVVRVIDAYIGNLDLAMLEFTRSEPKKTGRPAYDPKALLKLYVYGYMNRIRSSRRLEAESKRNLEVLWLMRKLSPDHKTIANFRKDNPGALKNVFRDFVRLCAHAGLYGKELIAIDGSKFKAVNSKDRNFTKDKLKDRLERIDETLEAYLKELDETDHAEDGVEQEKTAAEIGQIIEGLKARKERYEGYAEELEASGENQKSLTDSDSRLMKAKGKTDVCYNVQTAVDAKHKLITEFEVTTEGNDLNQLTPMACKAKALLEVKNLAVVADGGYDSATDIAAAKQHGIEVHVAGTDYDICIPVAQGEGEPITSHANGKCVFIQERNIAVCPIGNVLRPGYYDKKRKRAVYYNAQACKMCNCRCTKHMQQHKVTMKEDAFTKVYDDKDLYLRQIHIQPEKETYAQRKSLSEHPFGIIKHSLEAWYCLVKGKEKVQGEFSLIFLAYNLIRVINILGIKHLLESIGSAASPAD